MISCLGWAWFPQNLYLPRTPCFVAEYTEAPDIEVNDAKDPTATMWPSLRSIMSGRNSLIIWDRIMNVWKLTKIAKTFKRLIIFEKSVIISRKIWKKFSHYLWPVLPTKLILDYNIKLGLTQKFGFTKS